MPLRGNLINLILNNLHESTLWEAPQHPGLAQGGDPLRHRRNTKRNRRKGIAGRRPAPPVGARASRPRDVGLALRVHLPLDDSREGEGPPEPAPLYSPWFRAFSPEHTPPTNCGPTRVGPYNILRMSGRPFDSIHSLRASSFDGAQDLGGEPFEPLPPSLGLLPSTASADFARRPLHKRRYIGVYLRASAVK
jgi:hypothetical protein